MEGALGFLLLPPPRWGMGGCGGVGVVLEALR